MTETQRLIELHSEYARVLKLAEVHGIPVGGLCKIKVDNVWMDINYPRFDSGTNIYSFALCILENKPVFSGDRVWSNFLNKYVLVSELTADGAYLRFYGSTYGSIGINNISWEKAINIFGRKLILPRQDLCPSFWTNPTTNILFDIVNNEYYTWSNKEDKHAWIDLISDLLRSK